MLTEPQLLNAVLLEGARYARRIAPTACGDGIAQGETGSCCWYHGFWPQLRLLGLGSDPYRHADFFRRAVARLPGRDRALRILVCGTADYAMPALVHDACLTAGRRHEITVLDRCATPGLLCRWYAERTGWPVEVVTVDLLAWQPAVTFDAIFTHSLFPLFTASDRLRVVAAWRRMLRPGGWAVTVSRVGADSAALPPCDPGTQLAEAAVRAARDHPQACVMPLEQLATSAGEFARRLPVHAMGDAGQTRRLFEDSGFTLVTFDTRRRRGSRSLASGSVGVAKSAEYAEIIAERH